MTKADEFAEWCNALTQIQLNQSATIGGIQSRCGNLEARVNQIENKLSIQNGDILDLYTRVAALESPLPEPQPSPEPSPTPVPTPTPTPAPSPLPVNTSNPVVGQPYTWTNPYTLVQRTFIVARVVKDATLSNPDTGLLLNSPDVGNRTVYVNCHIEGSRYALWMDHQEDVVFDNCTFEDDYGAPGMSEESTVRVEDCSHILFKQCNIRGFSQPNGTICKHVFRVHGNSNDIVVATALWVSEGNGFMAGTYLGGPPSRVELTLTNVRLVCGNEGNDCFDPKRDGSLPVFNCINVDVRYGSQQWDAPANVRENPYPGWNIVNLTSGRNV